eukprot:1464704-Rhodomonas_salina.3
MFLFPIPRSGELAVEDLLLLRGRGLSAPTPGSRGNLCHHRQSHSGNRHSRCHCTVTSRRLTAPFLPGSERGEVLPAKKKKAARLSKRAVHFGEQWRAFTWRLRGIRMKQVIGCAEIKRASDVHPLVSLSCNSAGTIHPDKQPRLPVVSLDRSSALSSTRSERGWLYSWRWDFCTLYWRRHW